MHLFESSVLNCRRLLENQSMLGFWGESIRSLCKNGHDSAVDSFPEASAISTHTVK